MFDTTKVIIILNGERVEKELIQHQNGFDPMTGEPVIEYMIQNGFNPMTGEALYETVVQSGFDSMTGQSVYVLKSALGNNKKASFISVLKKLRGGRTGSAIKPVNGDVAKTLVSKLPIIGIAGGCAAALIVGAVVLGGVIGGPRAKIAKAFYKTLKEDSIGKNVVELVEVLGEDKLTVEMEGSFAKYNGKCSVGIDYEAAKLGVDASIDGKTIDQTAQFYYDEKGVQLALPNMVDEIYEYDCTKNYNNGFLSELIESNTDGTIKDLNTILSCNAKMMKSQSEYGKLLKKEVIKATKELDIKKAGTEYYTIDGKDRKCKGYTIVIDDKFISELMEGTIRAQDKAYGELSEEMLEAIANLTGEEMPETDEMLDEIIDNRIEFDDIEIDVYLYKGELAAIEYDDLGKVELLFEGGDTRTSNIVLKVDDEKVLEKESRIEKGKEKGTVEISGQEMEYSYDTKTGELNVEVDGYDMDIKLLSSNKGVEFGFEAGFVRADFNVLVKKGCHVSKLKGETIDIGELTEDDMEELAEELSEELQDSFEELDDFLYRYIF